MKRMWNGQYFGSLEDGTEYYVRKENGKWVCSGYKELESRILTLHVTAESLRQAQYLWVHRFKEMLRTQDFKERLIDRQRRDLQITNNRKTFFAASRQIEQQTTWG